MTGTVRPFLDFYGTGGIIPTEQLCDSTHLRDHRRFLLHALGIVPAWLEGRSIFELGPGNGQKARDLLRYRPRHYVAVDGNPASVEQTKAQLADRFPATEVEIIFGDFSLLEEPRRFDLVIAEAVVPTQLDAGDFLRRLLALARPGGVLVFTCMDSCSLLAEILRRAISTAVTDPGWPLEEQARVLVDFFESDLAQLPGMTRRPQDWAIDQLIHPWVGPLLGMPDAFTALEGSATFLGSSPRFFRDWLWYKSPEAGEVSLRRVTQGFWETCHNLIDTRTCSGSRDPQRNRNLYRATDAVYELVMSGERMPLREIQPLLEHVRECLPRSAGSTAEALTSFIRFAQSEDLADLVTMRPWWGRGQQYVSVIAEGGE